MPQNRLKLIVLMTGFFCWLSGSADATNKSIVSAIDAVILERSTDLVKHPINTNKTQDQARFGLVLFYKFGCIHCQKFDATFHRFIEQNPTPVLAYTLDGQSFPSLPNSVTPTNEELHRFFPNGNPAVPTVFLVDSKTHHIFPALKGEASIEQFSQRIRQLESEILQHTDPSNTLSAANVETVQLKTPQLSNDFHEQDFSYERD